MNQGIVSASSSASLLTSAGRFATLAAFAISTYVILAILVEQTGAPQSLVLALTGLLVLPVALLVGVQTRTMSINEWTVAQRACSPTFAGLAQAATILSVCGLTTLAGRIFHGGGDALAWMTGPILGLVSGSVLIAPYLRKSGALSLAELVAVRHSSRFAGGLVALALVTSSFLLCWSTMALAISQASHFMAIPRTGIAFAMAATVLVCILPGGIRGTTRANALVYVAVAIAFVVPVTWLSLTHNGWPITQLGYGIGALVDVADIEGQLRSFGGGLIGGQVAVPGGDIESGSMQSAAMMLFLAMGISATPLVLGQAQAMQNMQSTFKASGYALMMSALVISVVPAMAAFAKLGLYDDFLGISFADPETFPNWLFSFTPLSAASDPQTAMADICGRQAVDLADALAACGGDSDKLLRLGDFRLSADTVTLGFGQIFGLPAVAGLLTGLASVLLPLALANTLAQASAAVLARMSTIASSSTPLVATGRLFGIRLFAVLFVGASAWLGGFHTGDPAVPAYWGFAASGATVFPVVVMTIWWGRFSRLAAIISMLTGMAILAGFAFMPTGISGSPGGPFVGIPLAAGATFIAMIAVVIVATAVSMLRGREPNRPLLDAIRLPDTEPLLRAPSN
ncbi:MAG: hypothetical protein R3D32_07320 [Nitratireductor sp.]